MSFGDVWNLELVGVRRWPVFVNDRHLQSRIRVTAAENLRIDLARQWCDSENISAPTAFPVPPDKRSGNLERGFAGRTLNTNLHRFTFPEMRRMCFRTVQQLTASGQDGAVPV